MKSASLLQKRSLLLFSPLHCTMRALNLNHPATDVAGEVWRNRIATLTIHNFTAAAAAPDGDAISYSWNFGGGITSSNQNQSVTYQNANTTTFQAVVTVTDSRGRAAPAVCR
jgi:hypothetical protein